eukprot:gene7978-biopygen6759
MTILVTGSAGHLGEALMRSLRARNVDAVGLDLKPSPYTDAVGSITDAAFVQRRSLSIGVRNGALEEVEREESRDLGLRVFV